MATTSFRLDPPTHGLLSKGYSDESFQPATFPNIYLRPAGALDTSPREMALFVRMLLNRGRASDRTIISSESLARMERPVTTLAAQAGLNAGYGLGLYPTLDLPARVFGHNGGIEGFLSDYAYAPDDGFGYAILVNSTVSGEAGRQIGDIAFRFLSKSSLPRPEKAHLPSEQLRAFSGHYRQANPRNQVLAFLSFLIGARTLFVRDGYAFPADARVHFRVIPLMLRIVECSLPGLSSHAPLSGLNAHFLYFGDQYPNITSYLGSAPDSNNTSRSPIS